MVKVAIVGPQENRWTKEQKEKAIKEISLIFRNYASWSRPIGCEFEDIILVSGHCPKGGVDIWAEEVARMYGCYYKEYIFVPDIEQWEDDATLEYTDGEPRVKGYRSRNIMIAKTCDILYCIVPNNVMTEKHYCNHCQKWGHPTNGGCWTMNYAKKLGKATHLVVIK